MVATPWSAATVGPLAAAQVPDGGLNAPCHPMISAPTVVEVDLTEQVSAIVTPEVDVGTRLPCASATQTRIVPLISEPATKFPGGSTTTSFVAVPAAMSKAWLVAGVSPAARATSV